MIRDRYLLRLIITALGLLIVAQIVGQGLMNHWRAQDDRLSQPDPAYLRMPADHKH